ncbi:MAG: cell division protein FtsW [Parasphingorhabdus sp.]|jgi:cell division protein FtsW
MQAIMRKPLDKSISLPRFDGVLTVVVGLLLAISLVMVFSTTFMIDHAGASGSAKVLKHGLHIAVGIGVALVICIIPTTLWQNSATYLLVAGLVLLLLVLIPGIGLEINGGRRWFGIGGMRLQPSEIMKLIMVIYMADYLTRRRQQLKNFRLGVFNVVAIVSVVGTLLLLEPDLGTTVVIALTVFMMMFVSGVRFSHMLLCVSAAAAAFVSLVLISPYRMQRVLSFQDPWADPYGSGFQLSQALIAFGRGEWFGAGLGQSIQKLSYLPHASNDFLAAVIAEELGFAGIALILVLYAVLLWRGFDIAARAERLGHDFQARIAHGAAILLSIQALINLGVNMGTLPTKGLTLPLMSYGGSSMLTSLALVGLMLAVDREIRKPARRSK